MNTWKARGVTIAAADIERISEVGSALEQAKLFIDDTPGQTILRIAAIARRMKKEHGVRLVVIDYFQLIHADDSRLDRNEQEDDIARRLKFLARELELPVVVLSQVDRNSEDRQDHRPRLGDIRAAGLVHHADTVILLHRDFEEFLNRPDLPDRAFIIVGKQRNGPTGELLLKWVKESMCFENYAYEHEGKS